MDRGVKTVIHILNQVHSKSVSKTSYALWTGRKLSLNYLCVWGCPAEVKIFNPNAGILEPKTVSCYFIGYLKKSKGFCFYCHNRHTKYVEMRHIVFLDDGMMRGSIVPQEISLKEKRVYVPTPMIHEPIPPVHVHEHIIRTFEIGSSSAAPNVNEVHVIQESEVPNVVIDKEEDQPKNLKIMCQIKKILEDYKE
jgi:hypothetical protein